MSSKIFTFWNCCSFIFVGIFLWENGQKKNQPLKSWTLVNKLPGGLWVIDSYLIDLSNQIPILILKTYSASRQKSNLKFNIEQKTKSVLNLNFIEFIKQQLNLEWGHFIGQGTIFRQLTANLTASLTGSGQYCLLDKSRFKSKNDLNRYLDICVICFETGFGLWATNSQDWNRIHN